MCLSVLLAYVVEVDPVVKLTEFRLRFHVFPDVLLTGAPNALNVP